MASNRREFKGLVDNTVTVITLIFGLYIILYVSHTFLRLGIDIDVVVHRALFLTFLITLSFLHLPMTKGAARGNLPWYDLLFLILGAAGPLYMVFTFGALSESRYPFDDIYPFEIGLGMLTIVAILEITRRAVGAPMAILSSLFLLHMWFGGDLPGILWVNESSLKTGIHYIVFSNEGIFGVTLGVASTIIIMFVIFGQFLLATPAGQFFLDIPLAVLGHVRGGPAKVAVVASSLFGSLSGSPSANVATTGAFTIPMMKRIGYSSNFAGAVEAVASSGGQLMPPIMGVCAFIMAQLLGISYWTVCVAAFLPCLLYYVAVFIAVDAEAVKNRLEGLPRDQCPSVIKTLKEGWIAILPLAVLVYLLGVLHYSATSSVLYALLVLIVVSMIPNKTRLKPSHFVSAFKNSGPAVLTAGNACACAGIMIGALMVTQFGIRITDIIVSLSGGNLLFLLVLAGAVTYMLGMGTGSVPAYLMVAVLVAPALLKLGVPPLAAHMFVFFWIVIHFYTPPVCTAAYVAAGISGGNPIRTGFTAMRISVASYVVAFMLVYRPELLMLQGSPLEIILVFLMGAVAVTFLAWGLAGFLLTKKLNALQRVLLISAGTVLFFPYLVTNILGLALGGGVFLLAYSRTSARQ
ncbi:TRAP transporter permease [Chloroflexota bacterium]